jgi:SAM-dependent methyltransferase
MNGWRDSASAWITEIGEHGDKGRRFVLDRAMLARIEGRSFGHALDVGCGEGRFCRMLRAKGVAVTGLDPTPELLARARELNPGGTYIEAPAEKMPLPDASFDLVVSYLSLIDIPDFRAAISEMARVLKPGGVMLVANLTPMSTAGAGLRWQRDGNGNPLHYAIDNYLHEWAAWEEWRGIRIQNWHRPISAYMKAFLGEGLRLSFFDEPLPHDGDPTWMARYKRLPWFVVMEWEKPG